MADSKNASWLSPGWFGIFATFFFAFGVWYLLAGGQDWLYEFYFRSAVSFSGNPGATAGNLEGRTHVLPPNLLRTGRSARPVPEVLAEFLTTWLNEAAHIDPQTHPIRTVPGGLCVIAPEPWQESIADLLAQLDRDDESPSAEGITIAPWNDEPHQALLEMLYRPLGPLQAANVGELMAELRRRYQLPVAIEEEQGTGDRIDEQTPIEDIFPGPYLASGITFHVLHSHYVSSWTVQFRDGSLWIGSGFIGIPREPVLLKVYPLAPGTFGTFNEVGSLYGPGLTTTQSTQPFFDRLVQAMPPSYLGPKSVLLCCNNKLLAMANPSQHLVLAQFLREAEWVARVAAGVEKATRPEPKWKVAARTLQKRVTVRFANLPIADALRAVSEQTGVPIEFEAEAWARYYPQARISCDARDLPLGQVFKKFKPHPGYVGIVDGKIVFGSQSDKQFVGYPLRHLADSDAGIIDAHDLNIGMQDFATSGADIDFRSATKLCRWTERLPTPTLFVYQEPEIQLVIEDLLQALTDQFNDPERREPVVLFDAGLDSGAVPEGGRQPIDVEIRQRPLRDSLADLAERTGVNIIVDGNVDWVPASLPVRKVTNSPVDFEDEHRIPTISFSAYRTPLVEAVRAMARERGYELDLVDEGIYVLNRGHYLYDIHTFREPGMRLVFYPTAPPAERGMVAGEFGWRNTWDHYEAGEAGLLALLGRTAKLQCQSLEVGVLVLGDEEDHRLFALLRDEYRRVRRSEPTTTPRVLIPASSAAEQELQAKLDQRADLVPGDRSRREMLVELAERYALSLVISDIEAFRTPGPKIFGTLRDLRVRDLLAHLLVPVELENTTLNQVVCVRRHEFSPRDPFLAIYPYAVFEKAYGMRGNPVLQFPIWLRDARQHSGLAFCRVGDAMLVYDRGGGHGALERELKLPPLTPDGVSFQPSAAELHIREVLTKPIEPCRGELTVPELVDVLVERAQINVVWHKIEHPQQGPRRPEFDLRTVRSFDCRAGEPLEAALTRYLDGSGLTAFIWRDALVICQARGDTRFAGEIRHELSPSMPAVVHERENDPGY